MEFKTLCADGIIVRITVTDTNATVLPSYFNIIVWEFSPEVHDEFMAMTLKSFLQKHGDEIRKYVARRYRGMNYVVIKFEAYEPAWDEWLCF